MPAEPVTHVFGTICHLCLGPLKGASTDRRQRLPRAGGQRGPRRALIDSLLSQLYAFASVVMIDLVLAGGEVWEVLAAA